MSDERFTRDVIITSNRGGRGETNSFNVLLDGTFLFFVGLPFGSFDEHTSGCFADTLVGALNRDVKTYPSISNLSLGRVSVP